MSFVGWGPPSSLPPGHPQSLLWEDALSPPALQTPPPPHMLPNPSGTLPLLQAPSLLLAPAAGRPRPRSPGAPSELGLLPAGGAKRPCSVFSGWF